jgi:hypothetical protein
MWQGMTPDCDTVMKGFVAVMCIAKTIPASGWSGAKEQGRSLLQS